MLTTNDNAVLSQIFDPESAPSSGILVDASLPPDPILDSIALAEIKAEEKSILMEVENIMREPKDSARRQDILTKAYSNLETLIDQFPNSAALLNDHAQIFRLLHGDNVIISYEVSPLSSDVISKASKALSGLNQAIRILSPPTPQAGVSPTQCRTLAQAHTQRGALYHAASKALTTRPSNKGVPEVVISSLRHWKALDFEEAASRDFFMGGRYGNEVGKALAVHTNPTAKLCGQMVQDAMRREFAPSLKSSLS